MSNNRINLDNASTTPIDPRVLSEVIFHLKNTMGNAGSIHEEGVRAKKVLEGSRKKVAEFLGAHSDEIVFTSGGTESNNLAILGVMKVVVEKNLPRLNLKSEKRFNLGKFGKLHAITTKIEHSSVLECFRVLEEKGVEVTYLSVNSRGIVDLVELKKALRPETFLVSIQYANNEIGTIQPIREISKFLRNYRKSRIKNQESRIKNKAKLENSQPIFHTDASQAPAYLDCNVERLGVDLLTLDGHKIYGPKGVGALYIKRETPIFPTIFGGGQERGLRSGTENIPLIAGLAKALEICGKDREKESKRLTKLRDQLYSDVLKNIRIGLILNGDRFLRLPNNLNFSIKDIDTEFFVLQLDAKGISVSTKSACLESENGSYVVRALGGELWRSKNTLRITLGRFTEKSDIQMFLKKFSEIIKK